MQRWRASWIRSIMQMAEDVIHRGWRPGLLISSEIIPSNRWCIARIFHVRLWGISREIGHFRVPKPLTFKMRLGWVHNLSCEKWFPYQRLSSSPRFETEAPGGLRNGLIRTIIMWVNEQPPCFSVFAHPNTLTLALPASPIRHPLLKN